MNLSRISCLCLLVLALPAQAVEFNRVLPERSQIAFVTTQMGASVAGEFRNFRVDLAFDPDSPASAHARIEIDLASIDAGSEEGNNDVKGADWLHVAAYPKAHFESTSVRSLGRGRYEVRGRLSIHGRSHEVKSRFTFARLGSEGIFHGRFNIKRLDYGIGQRVWGDTGVVSDAIRIKFRIVVESGG